jgi:hypothetical protein
MLSRLTKFHIKLIFFVVEFLFFEVLLLSALHLFILIFAGFPMVKIRSFHQNLGMVKKNYIFVIVPISTRLDTMQDFIWFQDLAMPILRIITSVGAFSLLQ